MPTEVNWASSPTTWLGRAEELKRKAEEKIREERKGRKEGQAVGDVHAKTQTPIW